MFGEVAQDLVRMPLVSPPGMGGGPGDKRTSWEKVAANIARVVYDCMDRYPTKTECWFTRTPNINITRQENGKTVVLRRFAITRLLAFLVHPTPENWVRVSTIQDAFRQPFSHFCGRGLQKPGQPGWCVNGLFHGRFATILENESHKYCGNGARALCPGHGDGQPLVHCIFTHPDGRLQPCRNKIDAVPSCDCQTKCY